MVVYLFFFFQAEDGIRDGRVTGVQTCALPISAASASAHSRQVKTPRACRETVIAKACASHGALNTGPAWSRGSAGRARRSASGGIEVVIPEIDVHAVARGGAGPPQLARGEAHAVAVLGLLVARHGVGVGEDEDAVVAVDNAALAARVARQARVADGVVVVREDAV